MTKSKTLCLSLRCLDESSTCPAVCKAYAENIWLRALSSESLLSQRYPPLLLGPLRQHPIVLAEAVIMDKVPTVLRYLEPLPLWEEIKPYQIVGKLNENQSRNNLVLSEHHVEIDDIMKAESAPALDTCGFLYEKCDTGETLADRESIDRHIETLETWLSDMLGLIFVKTFEYRVSICIK